MRSLVLRIINNGAGLGLGFNGADSTKGRVGKVPKEALNHPFMLPDEGSRYSRHIPVGSYPCLLRRVFTYLVGFVTPRNTIEYQNIYKWFYTLQIHICVKFCISIFLHFVPGILCQKGATKFYNFFSFRSG